MSLFTCDLSMLSIPLNELLGTLVTPKRTGSLEACSHCKTKLIIRCISSNRNCKLLKFH
ncbi:hypothetical protein SLEP1_g38616 [Rubroshorea leprosula]|uniref:Uncharacterized protein n=1 Tax=Rubroshorea leprosula TaxID=152421 RepID=A0AAV5KYM5_9ROSI|nr:hypothetical protein SLEP1_g38616 [Rubroshorea leprosula]